jgi:hypothetical protein
MDFDAHHHRRSAEKQASREADQRALESGEKSREELRRECGLLSFRNVKVYYAGRVTARVCEEVAPRPA